MSTSPTSPVEATAHSSDFELIERTLVSHRDYYDELSETWRQLDSKAQSGTALVGILLAAFVAFVTKSQTSFSVADLVLCVVEILLLAAAAVLFVLVIRPTESEPAPFCGKVQAQIKEILGEDDPARIAVLTKATKT